MPSRELTDVEAVADLARRDPRLPMLSVLLDDEAFTTWFRTQLGGEVDVRRRYLRYKPGTSCVVAAELTTAHGRQDVVVAGYSASALVKAEKTLAVAGPGAVIANDTGRRILATTPAADRWLPALRLLADPRRRDRHLKRLLHSSVPPASEGPITTRLSYKPQRRWVGLLHRPHRDPVVLRCYRPQDCASALESLTRMAAVPVARQRLIGADARRGVLALEHVPGRTIEAEHDDAGLREVGRALAGLHAHRVDGCGPDPQADSLAVRRAAGQVGRLLPDLARDVADVAAAVRVRLTPTGPQVALHGDFSLDQVIAGPGGLSFIDFDRATRGGAEVDLGSLASALLVHGDTQAVATMAQVLAGYAEVRPVPDEDLLATQTAAHLLRRVAEPFRSCRSDWAGDVARIVATAAEVLQGVSSPTGGAR